MERLAFCTDEHVPHAFVTALDSNGFDVCEATTERGQTVDSTLLAWSTDQGRVLVTNDRDFVTLARDRDHAGVVIYTSQTLPAGDFARAIRRLDREYTPQSIANRCCWLEQWL